MSNKNKIGSDLIDKLDEIKKIINDYFLIKNQTQRREDIEIAIKKHFRFLEKIDNYFAWQLNIDDQFTNISPKVEVLLGYKPDEVLLKTFYEFIPEQEKKEVEKKMRSFIQEQISLWDLTYHFLHKDGHLVKLGVNGLALFNEKDNFCGYEGISYEIK